MGRGMAFAEEEAASRSSGWSASRVLDGTATVTNERNDDRRATGDGIIQPTIIVRHRLTVNTFQSSSKYTRGRRDLMALKF
jgi:hypothetical protein